MQLSVIIVNYNVKYFLEQCLCSVKKAMEEVGHSVADDEPSQTEVFVVDNKSTDDSIGYLRSRFPFVQFIANTENLGFARANNQALLQCRGKYILFLNPDTILPEDCFVQCLSFMEAHADAGALGVRMIDGSGSYLPESKRGFPSPWVSFCKMSGLTRLFPTSPLFARYYLGHLSPDAVHPVDVLSGAFMWVRKEVLDKTGGFDERFFMYAEDIDLSYRIQQSGYINYYLPAPVIIHFKGESTRRDARYVKLFYTAMIQFVQKHYRGVSAWWYTKLLQGIIAARSLGANKQNAVPGKPGLSGTPKVWLNGDESAIENMRAILQAAKYTVAATSKDAGVLIFCEGPTFPFTAIIKELQSKHNYMGVHIHGSHTSSAVGSGSKDSQGNAICGISY
ncbi:glycosyltransferase family 2 protein [Paraflavitalea soli]|uniref:Glycosyltransferase family 2 protein n=1 Tax=Paraflavitalea soli TaxID=2315862 RepID=A0A3B7MTT3_9BACT|nr:glycosyltransferase family 2 protein [Paraflavitalea soli]AXY76669.1 glycosyltransferase family 2 protein [Paraflavitalea soli]